MVPRCEITDDEEKFQVAVDVNGMDVEDLRIHVEGDGHVLAIEGKRVLTDGETYRFATTYSQQFVVDPSVVDVDKFTARLRKSDGVLVITAPKDIAKMEDAVRVIPVDAGCAPRAEQQRFIDAGEPFEV